MKQVLVCCKSITGRNPLSYPRRRMWSTKHVGYDLKCAFATPFPQLRSLNRRTRMLFSNPSISRSRKSCVCCKRSDLIFQLECICLIDSLIFIHFPVYCSFWRKYFLERIFLPFIFITNRIPHRLTQHMNTMTMIWSIWSIFFKFLRFHIHFNRLLIWINQPSNWFEPYITRHLTFHARRSFPLIAIILATCLEEDTLSLSLPLPLAILRQIAS